MERKETQRQINVRLFPVDTEDITMQRVEDDDEMKSVWNEKRRR